MTNKVKVAFIGAGYMAEQHIIAFKDIKNVQLVGIYSRTWERSFALAERYSIPNVCISIKDLFERTDAQLVIIAVSEDSIREVCFDSFQFPWKCLIEKPIGYNMEEAGKILTAFKSGSSEVYVGLNRRHYASTKAVIDQLKADVGQRVIHVFDQQDFSEAIAAGRPPHVVENLMFMNSIHIVDYLCFLGRGTINKIENLIPWDPASPSFVLAKISYSSGDIGIYEAVWNRPAPWRVTVSTDQIFWEMRPLESASFITPGIRSVSLIDQHPWDKDFKPGLRAQAEAAISMLQEGVITLPTLAEAIRAQELVASIYGL